VVVCTRGSKSSNPRSPGSSKVPKIPSSQTVPSLGCDLIWRWFFGVSSALGTWMLELSFGGGVAEAVWRYSGSVRTGCGVDGLGPCSVGGSDVRV